MTEPSFLGFAGTVARRLRAGAASGLLAALLLAAGCGGAVLPQIRTDADRMPVARKLIADDEYLAAIGILKGYIERNAGASDVDAAIYLLGECYLHQKEWTSAQLEFERLIRDYPESDSSGSASFRLGDALYGQARGPDFDVEFIQKALAQWIEYRQSYPGHWRQEEANGRVLRTRDLLAKKLLVNARLYTKLRMVGPARIYYQRVLSEYGDLALAGEAEIGLAICDRLDGKKAEAIERLLRIEQEHANQPAAAAARAERLRTEKMKVKVAKPVKPMIPDPTAPTVSRPPGSP